MNAVANRMAPSITTLIRVDHSHAMAVFHRYRVDTAESKKRALVLNACLAIEVHAQLEEEIFYPALRNVMSGDEVLDKSKPEHDEMRQLIVELRALSNSEAAIDSNYDEKFFQLMRVVIHHVADEETRLLPAAERLLGDQLQRLGMEMTKRRLQLLAPHTLEIAATSVRSFPVVTAAFLTAGAALLGAALLSGRSSHPRRLLRR